MDLMTTRQRLYGPDVDMDELQEKLWDLECGHTYPVTCFCCPDGCCAFCCDEANEFTYSSDEDD